MIKKIAAIVLAVTLAACTLTGCNKDNKNSSSAADTSSATAKDNTSSLATFDPDNSSADQSNTTPEPSLKIDGKEIDTSNFTMCTIDGHKIDFDTFRYYYYNTLSYYQQSYGVDMDTIKGTEGGFDAFKNSVISSLKQKILIDELAEKYGCQLTDAQKKTSVTDTISTIKSQFDSEQAYKDALKAQYHTDKTYEDFLTTQALYKNVTEKVFKNEGAYATKYDDFRKIIQDSSKYAHEIHVMIPYCAMVEVTGSTASSFESMSLSEKISAKYSAYSALDEKGQKEAKEKAKKTAEEVLKKAQDGEDFQKLIDEYGWDVTLDEKPEGLYLNKENAVSQGFPEELVNGAFSVSEGKICNKLMENETYGYFIVKRLPVDMDYVNKNISDLCYDYDAPNISTKMETLMKKMKVTYCDGWDKISADSIT